MFLQKALLSSVAVCENLRMGKPASKEEKTACSGDSPDVTLATEDSQVWAGSFRLGLDSWPLHLLLLALVEYYVVIPGKRQISYTTKV